MSFSAGLDNELEDDILLSFGDAIVEFEDTLFQKFVLLSSRRSLITSEMFRRYLKMMQSKGYVTPIEFHGRKAWKRMVVLDYASDTLIPRRVTYAQPSESSGPSRELVRRGSILSEACSVAERIQQDMLTSLSSEHKTRDATTLSIIMSQHVRNMHRTLARSRLALLEYLNHNVPGLRTTFDNLLTSKDETTILIGLRILENTHLMTDSSYTRRLIAAD